MTYITLEAAKYRYDKYNINIPKHMRKGKTNKEVQDLRWEIFLQFLKANDSEISETKPEHEYKGPA